MTTAKIILRVKEGDDPVRLEFHPDYQDGRNKEWASATPALSLSMTVKREVAEQFSPGTAYVLTFEEADDQPASASDPE